MFAQSCGIIMSPCVVRKTSTARTQMEDGLRGIDRLSKQMEKKKSTNLTVVYLFIIDSVYRVN